MPSCLHVYTLQVDDDTNLTAKSLVSLHEKGYLGGLAWAFYEVTEEPGGSLTAPRVIVPHEQWPAYASVLSKVQEELSKQSAG